MYKARLLFEKRGTARYMSHLDLMQVFRRAFSRCGVRLTYSQGFHPHASINILLPLPTAFESGCELMDIELAADRLPDNFIFNLNRVLPAGVTVKSVTEPVLAVKHLAYVDYEMRLGCDAEPDEVKELFAKPGVVVSKKSKRGTSNVDITPLIFKLEPRREDGELVIVTRLGTGEKSLNPEYIAKGIEQYLNKKVEYELYSRLEIYDENGKVFR